jgi:hypothetical protein
MFSTDLFIKGVAAALARGRLPRGPFCWLPG